MEKQSPADFIKDPYLFEFLNISQPNNANEKEIESALIDNLQHFLMELGKGFSFVGRQFRISTETTHFYIDLVGDRDGPIWGERYIAFQKCGIIWYIIVSSFKS